MKRFLWLTVMVLLSLGVLWIPSNKSERSAVICCLLIIQSLYLQYLAYKIPCNGDSTPYIGTFQVIENYL